MSGDPIVRGALSIGVATGVYAVSFGVLSVAAGFSVVQTCVMSLVCFTGASQLTFASVIGAGGGVAGALPPALLLAGRNTLYAFSLRGVLSGTVPKRALRAQLVVDETTAMAHAQPTIHAKRRAFDLTALCLFSAWNVGTLIGAVAGHGLGNPRDYGLDAMFPAVFLALLAPQLRGPDGVRAAVAGGLIALALVTVTPAGVPIIASALGAVPVLLAAERRRKGVRR
ncbi:MAG TPA: AzlC family ABC transporter permease [Solirubrobacteraceae bacterium]|jgi:4-azaleucine resistance transporter AzlC|nr:AzlC family ABC transporter permease [Solirubrobacteraceae bacterium]